MTFKRMLDEMDLANLQGADSDLMSRMTLYEALDSNVAGRVTTLESRIVPKSAYVPKITNTPSQSIGVSVLGVGVQLSSAAAVTEQRSDIAALKSGHNAIVDVLISQNLMNPAP